MIACRYSREAMNIAATFIIRFMSLNAIESGASKNLELRTFVPPTISRRFAGVAGSNILPIDESHRPNLKPIQHVCHDTPPWLISVSFDPHPTLILIIQILSHSERS